MIHDPNRRFTYITNEISLRRKLWPLFMILYIYYIVWAKREAQVFFVNRPPRARQEAKKLNQPPWVTRVARGVLAIPYCQLVFTILVNLWPTYDLAPSRVKREAWGVLVNGIESTKNIMLWKYDCHMLDKFEINCNQKSWLISNNR